MNSAQQVQQVRRRLARSTAGPLIARLQLLTLALPPTDNELLDALLLCAGAGDPVERVWRCWQKWRIVMSNHERFGDYARRNLGLGWRP